MEYSAEILSVANADPVRRVDIEKFFQDRGLFAVDLTTGDLSQDFIYRPPLQVTIAGLPASMCNTADVPDNIPVLAKGDKINLEVSVVEDLGGGSTCPVDSATVTLFSEITDQQSTPLVLAIDSAAGGKVDTTLFVGQPNVLAGRVVDGVERSYQKVRKRPLPTLTEGRQTPPVGQSFRVFVPDRVDSSLPKRRPKSPCGSSMIRRETSRFPSSRKAPSFATVSPQGLI